MSALVQDTYVGYNSLTQHILAVYTQQDIISVVDSYRLGALVDMGDHSVIL